MPTTATPVRRRRLDPLRERALRERYGAALRQLKHANSTDARLSLLAFVVLPPAGLEERQIDRWR